VVVAAAAVGASITGFLRGRAGTGGGSLEEELLTGTFSLIGLILDCKWALLSWLWVRFKLLLQESIAAGFPLSL